MRNCPDFILTTGSASRVTAGLFVALAAMASAGCGKDANGDFRDFSDTAEPSAATDLPVITPGEPNADEPTDAEIATTATPASMITDAGTADGPLAAVEEAATDSEEPLLLKETGTRDEVVLDARDIKLLIEQKSFTRDKETKAIRVSYDDIDLLKILNMEPVPANAADHFPDWLKQLSGKQIRIRGFMYPPYSASGLTGFMLARDNGICCFVRQAKIYDLFVVRLADGEMTDYIQNRPFDVVGTFHIDPTIEDGELLQLYRIDEARVIEN